MAFDPRCVAFEGRLHADRRTAEYVGRGSHEADAACFRSARPAASSARSPELRVFYFETQILGTNSDLELAANSRPARTNISAVRRHAARDQDAAATIARDWRRRAEQEAMDLEDTQILILNPTGLEPVNFNFSLSPGALRHMRSRLDRRRLRRTNERKKFNHTVAVGFLVDEPEGKVRGYNFGSSFRSENGLMETRMSRRAVKQLMQRVLPDVTASADSESSEEEDDGKSRETYPAILHQDLGEAANSLAYVGKTGRVVSHGREVLQCARYGAGDVVGCGVLLDSNTFFFTLNGKLMGMLPARDVFNLDNFGEVDDSDEDDSSEGEEEEGMDENGGGADENKGVNVRVGTIEDVDMEDGVRQEEEKALYASVSLHGPGESVKAVFQPIEFKFDLSGFEKQIRKERQRALLEEREKRCEQSDDKDEAAMDTLVQDFLLHYGYESAYKAFESALAPCKKARLSSDSMDMDYGGETEASTVTLGVNSAEDMEDEEKCEDMVFGDPQPSALPITKQQMRESLSLRHEIREYIRRFQTAQALVLLEQHKPSLTGSDVGYRSRRFQKLMLYCRILCVVDILTREKDTKVATNGAASTSIPRDPQEVQPNGWSPVPAIEFARHILGSSFTPNGKRKRQNGTNGRQRSCEGTMDAALVMSLLLYDKRESIPSTSGALKYLSPEFRESVADEVNSFLLATDTSGNSAPRVSALEAFVNDLESLQKECLHQGGHVYPEKFASASRGKSKITSRRRQAAISSSSDDSSSSQSQSEQEGLLDDEDDE